jgi:hypothetical protein
MSTLGPIYASLAVPTSAAPSATCLQWTADGQLILVTKNAVHILVSHQFILHYSCPQLMKALWWW